MLQKVQNLNPEISFTLKSFKEVNIQEGKGASVIVSYKATTGQSNQFDLDVVYGIAVDIARVKSTISNQEYIAASIENIISDKVEASYKFRSGNTRMKDFDDLYRIKNSQISINRKKINDLFRANGIEFDLKKSWIDDEFQERWRRHSAINKDLPVDVFEIFQEINSWLKNFKD